VDVDSIISEAREILPGAFANQPEHPDRIEASEIEVAEPLPRRQRGDRNRDLDVQLPQLPLPENSGQFSETDREDAVEAAAAHRELGLEIFASYVSFHTTPVNGKWGIFYRLEGIRRLALLVMRDLGVDRNEASDLAFSLLRAHERFHYRFDLGALYDKLILRKPLYNFYSKEVYSSAICTSDCFEESLANRALVLFRHRGLSVSRRALNHFVIDFCRNSPPGYRDYDRDPVEMKERLLGQLRSGKIHERVVSPEREWLANFTHRRCPEYFVPMFKSPAGRFVRLKRGGHIWIIHRNDPDPWPSKPHAHDYEQRQKLDLASGKIFSLPGRNVIEKLRRKDLELLRVDLSRQQPDLELPPLVA
jgi:hypothetical protein